MVRGTTGEVRSRRWRTDSASTRNPCCDAAPTGQEARKTRSVAEPSGAGAGDRRLERRMAWRRAGAKFVQSEGLSGLAAAITLYLMTLPERPSDTGTTAQRSPKDPVLLRSACVVRSTGKGVM